jgi:putative CocE/NonD family hydrolase
VQTDNSIRVEYDVMVPMRDGVRLRSDIYVPSGTGPFPVLLCRYPYSTADGMMDKGNRQVASQGYAVVFQHCRGRYGSEGVFYPFHPDVQDGYDTVEWAASQPWSDGKVGMFGASHGGLAAWLAAMSRPPHLVAIAPVSASWSFIGCNIWYWTKGVLGVGFALMWTGQMTTWEAERRGIPQPLPVFAEIERSMHEMSSNPAAFDKAVTEQAQLLETLLGQRPLRDIEELRQLAPWWRDWCDHDDPADPYWRQVHASAHIESLALPIQHVTGWYDFFTNGVLDGYRPMKQYGVSDEVQKAQRLEVGPWSHVPGAAPRRDVPSGPGHPDMYALHPGSTVMEFFRHHLKGENPDFDDKPPVRIFVMGDNTWRDEWEWPLARTQWTSSYLRIDGNANTLDGDGVLSQRPPAAEPADEFVYDPNDPVPGPIGVGLTAGDEIAPRNTSRRPDVLVYTTTPLEHDVEITGPVTLELWAASSVTDTDYTAKLIDVFPDGELVAICQGIVRTRYVATHPMQPGRIYRFDIDMGATSNMFKAGHQIRLHVSSSEFPTYELNPNTGTRITHDTGQTVSALQRVFHDDLHPSRLILPVIPR